MAAGQVKSSPREQALVVLGELQGGWRTKAELSRAAGTSERSVKRILRALMLAGFTLEVDRKYGPLLHTGTGPPSWRYRVDCGNFIPPRWRGSDSLYLPRGRRAKGGLLWEIGNGDGWRCAQASLRPQDPDSGQARSDALYGCRRARREPHSRRRWGASAP